MFAPRTGTGFLFATFWGVITFVVFNPSTNDAVAMVLAMVVSIVADLFIRWRSARRLRQQRRDAGAHLPARRRAAHEAGQN